MKKILGAILLIILTTQLAVGQNSKEVLQILRNHFDGIGICDTTSKSVDIPKGLFKDEMTKEELERTVNVKGLGILNDTKNITCLLEFGDIAGGYSSLLEVFTFSPEGEVLNRAYVGGNMLDLGGGSECTPKFYQERLLEMKTIETELIEETDEYKTTSTSYDYFLINENGFKAIKFPFSIYKRDNQEISRRIFTAEELQQNSKSQLDIMRNEIFAAHGYIFKKEKWRNFFSKKEWYKPRYNNVTDKLTTIERINIQTILKVSSNI
ncbi:YARHG domain-containing protein [Puteibacter caeruleilacunae]|nr:YARHG domain-containing protein [Puteibacter caeruleilacunae]